MVDLCTIVSAGGLSASAECIAAKYGEMALKRPWVTCARVAIVIFVAGVAHGALASETETLGRPDTIAEIAKCLAAGKEALLGANSFDCVATQSGSDLLKNPPDEQACADDQKASKDRRRLPGDAIKRIATQKDSPIPATGIRIIGAVFCEPLDLVGLDLPYSLVVDKALFAQGIRIRNFHTRGDLSFDGSKATHLYRKNGQRIRNQIFIARSRIDGSLYAEEAKLKTLRVYDSEIGGSVLMRVSQFDEPAIFDTVSVKGELSVRGAKLSYFLLQFSKVGGILDLTDSTSRCAYRITKSEIKELIAVNAGFGIKRLTQNEFDWPPPETQSSSTQKTAEVAAASSSAKQSDKGCNFRGIAEPATFTVSDSDVTTGLCLQSFRWLTTKEQNAPPQGTMIFDDLKIGTTTWIDFAPKSKSTAPQGNAAKPRFNIVGVNTKSLNLNFDNLESINLLLSGLQFQQVYASPAECQYDPTFYNESDKRRVGNGEQFRLPEVNQVTSWLDTNCLQTTQPFSAFVAAARRAGDDETARELRIAQADRSVKFRWRQLWGAKRPKCSDGDHQPAPTRASSEVFIRILYAVSEFVAIAASYLLGVIADFGYRPEKVVWFVIGAVAMSWACFWWWLRVVGFAPKTAKNMIRAVGFIFLFDRLLPLYNIRKDDFEIDSFYKLTPRRRIETTQLPPKIMRYLWFKIPVTEVDERDARRIEIVLDWMRAIGMVLGIFLAAAVAALIRSQ